VDQLKKIFGNDEGALKMSGREEDDVAREESIDDLQNLY